MRIAFVLICLMALLSSCEDKKKPIQSKIETSKETVKDSIPAITPSEKKEIYPKITEENVITFLTDYGQQNRETKVKINTQHGEILIDLFEDTPLHRANFIYLVKRRYFENTFFHRVVPNFIIQGGNSDLRSTQKKRAQLGKDYLLPAELANNRKHIYGTISGAKEYRENPDKRTAPYEFFIFLGPQSSTAHLNGNYTIFGKVTKGMDVVETIANLDHDEGGWPLQNVYISAEVLD